MFETGKKEILQMPADSSRGSNRLSKKERSETLARRNNRKSKRAIDDQGLVQDVPTINVPNESMVHEPDKLPTRVELVLTDDDLQLISDDLLKLEPTGPFIGAHDLEDEDTEAVENSGKENNLFKLFEARDIASLKKEEGGFKKLKVIRSEIVQALTDQGYEKGFIDRLVVKAINPIFADIYEQTQLKEPADENVQKSLKKKIDDLHLRILTVTNNFIKEQKNAQLTRDVLVNEPETAVVPSSTDGVVAPDGESMDKKTTVPVAPKAPGSADPVKVEPVAVKLSKEDEVLERKLSSENIDNEIARIDKNIERVHGMRTEMGLNITEAQKVVNLPGFASARRNLENIKTEMEQLRRSADAEFTPEDLVSFKRLRSQAAKHMMSMRTAVQGYRKDTPPTPPVPPGPTPPEPVPPTPGEETEDSKREHKFRFHRDDEGKLITGDKVEWTDKKTGEKKFYYKSKEDKTLPLTDENRLSPEYMERREARTARKSKQAEYNKLFEKKSHKYLGKYLGLNPRGFQQTKDELNEAKKAEASILLPALLDRAKKQKEHGARARFSETVLDTQKLKNTPENKEKTNNALEGIERIDSAYKAWFIQRYVIDDAKQRIEAQGKLLSEEKQEQVKNLGAFLKKHKWKVRLGSIAAAGVVAAGGVAIAGAGLGAIATAGGTAALGKSKRVALGATVGVGAAMTAGAGVHRLFDSVVAEKKDRLIKTESRTAALSYDKLMADMDGYTDEYKDTYRDLQKTRTLRNATTAAAAIASGIAVGANADNISEAIANAGEGIGVDTGIPLTEAELPAGTDTGTPLTEAVLPNQMESVVTPEVTQAVELPNTPEVVENIEVTIPAPEQEFVARENPASFEQPANTDTVPGNIDKTTPAPRHVFPIHRTLGHTFFDAWNNGKLDGIPEGATNADMWEAVHALDNNPEIMELMKVTSNDLDVVKNGQMINLQPLVDYMNGKTIVEIETGLRAGAIEEVLGNPQAVTPESGSNSVPETVSPLIPVQTPASPDFELPTAVEENPLESGILLNPTEEDVPPPENSTVEVAKTSPESSVPPEVDVSPQVTETFDAETSHLIEGFNDTFKEYGFNPTDKEALVAEFVSRSDEVSDSLTLENLFKTIIQREYLTTKLDAAMGLASGESLAQLYSMKSDQLLGVIGNESLQGMFEKMNITFTDNLKNFMGTLHESRILNAGSTFKESLEKAMLDGNLKVYTDRVDVTIPGGMFTQPTTISIALNK